MQIIIDIPDTLYTTCQITSKINGKNDVADILIDAVAKGKPLSLPKKLTNGDVLVYAAEVQEINEQKQLEWECIDPNA